MLENVENKLASNDESGNETATEITVVDDRFIRDKIYDVRGVKVMLDFELAEIYGYSTSAFNQQVKNNAEKFDDDFRFQLTRKEMETISISKNLTSIQRKGVKGGRSKLPWAFTESGLYMLMTVLKGELATQQSKALIPIFRSMKDYILNTQGLAYQRDLLRLSMQTTENTEAIKNVQALLSDQQKLLMEHDDKLAGAFEQISETVKRSELSPVILQFKSEEQSEYLLLNGHPVKADVTYMDIYSKAKKSVYIIDNYINIKTLHLLQEIKPGVTVTIFTDNTGNKLHAHDYADFQIEFPTIPIAFVSTAGKVHDRYILLDYDEPDERMFLCGTSSKDAGVMNMSTIAELESSDIKNFLHQVIDDMKANHLVLNLR